MSIFVHPLSDVHPRAEIDDGCHIGPFCVVGPQVRLGANCHLDSHVVLAGNLTIGRDNRFSPGAVIGGEPQDLSYKGADTSLVIGDGNQFREGVSIHRGAEKEDGVTRIGNKNLFMATSHVGHNCRVGNEVVMANGSMLAGHVHVHDFATISGNCMAHHFATVGTLAFMSGGSLARTDIPPYLIAVGWDSPRLAMVNEVGMRRRGIPDTTIKLVKRAHRLLYRELRRSNEARDLLLADPQVAALGGTLPAELVTLFEFVSTMEQNGKSRQGEARRHQSPATPASTTPTSSTPTQAEQPLRRAA
jgi:UDP-N-acetylglucosamine acyltransferase